MDRQLDQSLKRHRYIHPDASPLELWLNRYQDALREEAACTERIERLEAYAVSTTRRITGMPHAVGDDESIPSLSDERDALRRRVAQSRAARKEISEALSVLPAELRRLMEAYYIDGKSWEASAEIVPCHPNYVAQLRKKALWLLREAGFDGQKKTGDQ